MNERIRELWNRAAELEPGPSWEGQVKFMEKFAELIVRECAEVCFRIDGEYDGEEVLATWCGDGILKHFGVEE